MGLGVPRFQGSRYPSRHPSRKSLPIHLLRSPHKNPVLIQTIPQTTNPFTQFPLQARTAAPRRYSNRSKKMTKPAPTAIETADKEAEAQHDGYQLTDKDIHQLALTDEEYKPLTWENLKAIIGSLNLHLSYRSQRN